MLGCRWGYLWSLFRVSQRSKLSVVCCLHYSSVHAYYSNHGITQKHSYANTQRSGLDSEYATAMRGLSHAHIRILSDNALEPRVCSWLHCRLLFTTTKFICRWFYRSLLVVAHCLVSSGRHRLQIVHYTNLSMAALVIIILTTGIRAEQEKQFTS